MTDGGFYYDFNGVDVVQTAAVAKLLGISQSTLLRWARRLFPRRRRGTFLWTAGDVREAIAVRGQLWIERADAA